MPRELTNMHGGVLERTTLTKLQCGDLLFVSKKWYKRMITHVALAIGDDMIFHCSYMKGSVIEKTELFFKDHVQEKDPEKMLSYVDPRTKPGSSG